MSGANTDTVTEQPIMSPKGKVLVVDDEEYVRGILATMLGSMGFESVEAKNGDEGLAAFTNTGDKFIACVIDLTMQGMGGMELLERIREVDPEVPVVLVSGYSPLEVRQKEAKSANISFLQKPFTLDQFRSSINAQLAEL
jgi:two-component system cell cycle sensor histidine kinase/response regulator CckA